MLNVVMNQWPTYGPNDDFPLDGDICGGDNLVETSGYMPKHDQIMRLFSSGTTLDAYRKAMYPNLVPVNSDDNPDYDPTGQIGYDFFDYHQDATFVLNKLTEQQRLSGVMPADFDNPAATKSTMTPPAASAPAEAATPTSA